MRWFAIAKAPALMPPVGSCEGHRAERTKLARLYDSVVILIRRLPKFAGSFSCSGRPVLDDQRGPNELKETTNQLIVRVAKS